MLSIAYRRPCKNHYLRLLDFIFENRFLPERQACIFERFRKLYLVHYPRTAILFLQGNHSAVVFPHTRNGDQKLLMAGA
jgi:hypothetical protein